MLFRKTAEPLKESLFYGKWINIATYKPKKEEEKIIFSGYLIPRKKTLEVINPVTEALLFETEEIVAGVESGNYFIVKTTAETYYKIWKD